MSSHPVVTGPGSNSGSLDSHRDQFHIPRKPVAHSPSNSISSTGSGYSLQKENAEAETKGLRLSTSTDSRQYKDQNVFDLWWLEISCCGLFLPALAAVIATLYPHHGHPIPQWPDSLSINTLIAIYIAILKAAILLVVAAGLGQLKWMWFRRARPLTDLVRYDMASRGPWGSMRLLWILRGRDVVASLGAALTICAISIDPLAQEIIRYIDCNVTSSTMEATIPRTSNWGELQSHVSGELYTIAPAMRNSVSAGVFSPGNTVAFTCPTGNCTFSSPYHTVGYCSSCSDISHQVKFTNEVNKTVSSYANGPSWQNITSLPSGLSITTSTNEDNRTAFATSVSSATGLIQLLVAPDPWGNNLYGNDEPDFGGDNSTAICANDPRLKGTWYCNEYGAASCTLYPCVRTYEAVVSNGRLTETLVSTSNTWTTYLDDYVGFALAMIDVECLSNGQQTSLAEVGFTFDGSTDWLPGNLDEGYMNGPNETILYNSILDRGCLYQFGIAVNFSVQSFLGSVFSGSVWEDLYGNIYGDLIQQMIYNMGNVSFESVNSTFANISEAMTQHMRQNGMVNFSAPAVGQVHHSATCVQVRWWWLALPAIMVCLTLVFFVFVLLSTRPDYNARNKTSWKSSPLALLFHGLDQDVLSNEQVRGDLTRKEEMDAIAKSLVVRLSPTGKGWNFVAA